MGTGTRLGLAASGILDDLGQLAVRVITGLHTPCDAVSAARRGSGIAARAHGDVRAGAEVVPAVATQACAGQGIARTVRIGHRATYVTAAKFHPAVGITGHRHAAGRVEFTDLSIGQVAAPTAGGERRRGARCRGARCRGACGLGWARGAGRLPRCRARGGRGPDLTLRPLDEVPTIINPPQTRSLSELVDRPTNRVGDRAASVRVQGRIDAAGGGTAGQPQAGWESRHRVGEPEGRGGVGRAQRCITIVPFPQVAHRVVGTYARTGGQASFTEPTLHGITSGTNQIFGLGNHPPVRGGLGLRPPHSRLCSCISRSFRACLVGVVLRALCHGVTGVAHHVACGGRRRSLRRHRASRIAVHLPVRSCRGGVARITGDLAGWGSVLVLRPSLGLSLGLGLRPDAVAHVRAHRFG